MENKTEKSKVGLRVSLETRKRMERLIAEKEPRWSLNDVGVEAVEYYLNLRKV